MSAAIGLTEAIAVTQSPSAADPMAAGIAGTTTAPAPMVTTEIMAVAAMPAIIVATA